MSDITEAEYQTTLKVLASAKGKMEARDCFDDAMDDMGVAVDSLATNEIRRAWIRLQNAYRAYDGAMLSVAWQNEAIDNQIKATQAVADRACKMQDMLEELVESCPSWIIATCADGVVDRMSDALGRDVSGQMLDTPPATQGGSTGSQNCRE